MLFKAVVAVKSWWARWCTVGVYNVVYPLEAAEEVEPLVRRFIAHGRQELRACTCCWTVDLPGVVAGAVGHVVRDAGGEVVRLYVKAQP